MINKNGFSLIDKFIDEQTILNIKADIVKHKLEARRGGIRNAAQKLPAVNTYLHSEGFIGRIQAWFNTDVKVVRSIIFNKNVENNWLVAWHQDKTVAVSKVFNAEGWGPWSVKDGTHHVQPPLDLINSMLTFRIHLDDCNLANGCLRVLPGSHTKGILPSAHLQECAKNIDSFACEGEAGSALVMHPLLIHASSKATSTAPRGVLHVECSSYTLPAGISWA